VPISITSQLRILNAELRETAVHIRLLARDAPDIAAELADLGDQIQRAGVTLVRLAEKKGSCRKTAAAAREHPASGTKTRV
jgi:hypothetical protein